MSNQTNFLHILNAISLQESAAGHSHSNSPDFPRTDPCGPAHAHVSHSPAQAKDSEPQTNGTCGPCSSASSRSAALSASLANKLKARLAKVGSTEYRQTWKEKATPAGRSYWAHTASAHRISAKDFTGWPTPKAQEDGRTLEQYEAARQKGYQNRKTSGGPSGKQGGLAIAAQLSGWPTPDTANVGDGIPFDVQMEALLARRAKTKAAVQAGEVKQGSGRGYTLQMIAQAAGWPTPCVQDGPKGGPSQGVDRLPSAAQMAGTPSALPGTVLEETPTNPETPVPSADSTTPTSANAQDQPRTELNTPNSTDGFTVAGWCSPASRDYKDTPGMATTGVNPDGSIRSRVDQLPRQAAQCGEIPNGTTAATASSAGFRLNPHFSRWLMGFPPAWCDCAVTAMQSFPKSRRSSSGRISKA